MPYSTGWPSFTRIFLMVPLMPASGLISLKTFIASIRQTTLASSTWLPTVTKLGVSGFGLR